MGAQRSFVSRRRLLRAAALLPVALLAGPGCGNGSSLAVFAASSLTEALEDAGRGFSSLHETTFRFSFAASSVLATQILEGAPADLYASADEVQMGRLVAAGAVETPEVIARNSLSVVAARGAEVRAFEDLATPGVRLVIAGPAVPVGRYARMLLERAAAKPEFGPDFVAAVLANIRSEELSARAVLAKVQLGEADAGFVFATDAAVAASAVDVLSIPEGLLVEAEYPAAVMRGSPRAADARAFLAFLLSPAGQEVLSSHGFVPVGGGTP